MEIKLRNNIGKIAEERGINPHQLALKTGIGANAMYALVRGDTDPLWIKAATLWRIAAVLGVKVDELLTVDE